MASLENFTSDHLKYCSYCKSCHFKNTNTTEEILWIPNYIHLKYQNSRPYHIVKTLFVDSSPKNISKWILDIQHMAKTNFEISKQ